MNDRSQNRQNAFTLIELVIAVAIVALLAAVAFPSYQEQIVRTRRAEGQAALMKAAAKQEQYYLDNKTYTDDMEALGYPSDPADSENRHYQIAVSAFTATSFTLEAAPQGAQADDAECGTLTLDHLGQKDIEGAGKKEDCW